MSAASIVDDLRASGPHLSVGILTADLLALGSELRLLEAAGARIVHTDVGDGRFCPLFTVGPPFVKAQRTSRLKDALLLIAVPLDHIHAFVEAGADIITFHVESARQPHRVLRVLAAATNANDGERGIVRGVALNPGTPLEVLEPLLDDCDYVLLLAIDPGWGGQSFIPGTEDRIERAAELIRASGRAILLGVDGGITRDNIARVAALAVDIIVSGSAVFDGRAAVENARFMLDQVQSARRAAPSSQADPAHQGRSSASIKA